MGFIKKMAKTAFRPVAAVTTAGGSEAYRYGKKKGAQGASSNVATNPQDQTDARIQKYADRGKKKGEELYGQTSKKTGYAVQDIIRRRKDALNGQDPASTRIREAANNEVRKLRSQSGSDGINRSNKEAQVHRNASAASADQLINHQNTQLDKYQDLMGNVASNQGALEGAYGGLGAGSQYVAPAVAQKSGGTIICTELHRQGYMSDETYEADSEYGRFIREFHPHAYIGYLFLAAPIVKIMRRSKLFTKLVSIPAIEWAKHMEFAVTYCEGRDSFLGRNISRVGIVLCSIVGRYLNTRKLEA